MKLVGLVSSYREGPLLEGCLRSLTDAGLDDLLVYEGPAGTPLDADVPESMFGFWADRVTTGSWRSDARKRNAMLLEAKRRHPEGPVWGVWLDGDEILVNAVYLRDRLQAVVWQDEWEAAQPLREPGFLERVERPRPTIHQPLRVVEADGSMAVTTSRLVRLDLVRSIDVSISVVTNEQGFEEAWGNRQEDARLWVEMWMRAVETGRMLAWPPLPCEPHIYHRSNLRHPLRRGLRMHKQENEELRKAGKL